MSELQQLHNRIEALEEEVLQLRTMLAEIEAPPVELLLGLSPAERTLLGLLLRRPLMTVHAAAMVLGGDGCACSPGTVRVRMCGLRRKLRPRRIEIETVTQAGWRLTDGARARLRAGAA